VAGVVEQAVDSGGLAARYLGGIGEPRPEPDRQPGQEQQRDNPAAKHDEFPTGAQSGEALHGIPFLVGTI
jgi:hypothetical protein